MSNDPRERQPSRMSFHREMSSTEALEAERAQRYACLRSIFTQRLTFTKDTLKYSASSLQLNDMRQDLKQIIDELKCCTVADNCDDFLQCDAAAAPIIARLAERVATEDRAQDRNKLKLSAVQTPKFSGDISDYLSFKSEFSETITSRASDMVALLKLREEALRRDSIEFKSVSGCRSLDEAFQALDSIYGDSELQRNSLLIRLRELPSVTRLTDSLGLRNIFTTLETIMRKLDLIQDCDLLDSATFSALMIKLPGRVRRDIDEKIFDRGIRKTAEKFQILIDICKRHAQVTDYHYYRTKAYGSSPSGAQGQGSSGSPSSLNLAGVAQNTSTCIFHDDAKRHRTPVCNRLLVLPTSEIVATLQRHGHCLCCFDKHVGQNKCRTRCSEPGCRFPASHGKLLHSAFVDAPPSVGASCNTQASSDRSPQAVASPPAEGSEGSENATDSKETAPIDYDSDCSVDSNVMSAAVTSSCPVPVSAIHSQQFSAELGRDTLRPCHKAFIMNAGNKLIPINVFYDLGSDLSQITYDCVSATALKPTATLPRLDLHVAGSKTAHPFGKSALFPVPIRDATGAVIFTLSCAAVPYIGQLRSVNTADIIRQFEGEGHDCSDALLAASGSIDCLVGCNVPELHPVRIAQIGSVSLAQNRFGKVIFGSHPTFPPSGFLRSRVVSTQLEGCMLMSEKIGDLPSSNLSQTQVRAAKCDDLFDRLAQVEDLPCAHCGHNRHDTRDEDRKLKIYRECLEFQPENKRVLARLPWNVDLSSVPDNRPAAEKRLVATTKSLQKDQRLLEAYRLEFQQMIEKGIIVPVTAEQDEQWRSAGGKVWYVAHFPVQNEKSASTPVRVVFDTSVPYKGIHLSKLWELPPNLIPDLRKMCIRFRDHSFALSLDFSKAYWTVYLRDIESHMQRLLWHGLVPGAEPSVYRMTRNSFGMVPSGAVCSLAMLMVAEHHRESHPHVYKFISEQVYVDDGVSSCKTLEEVFRLAQDISNIMSSGGFAVKHFMFGGTPDSMATLASSTVPDCATLAEQSQRVLGTTWNPCDDSLQVQCQINLSPRKKGKPQGEGLTLEKFERVFPPDLTLRLYMSAFASLFDPLGLVSPVTILLKHELGRLFQLGIKWDENIPHGQIDAQDSTYERCRALIFLIVKVASVRFERCLSVQDALPNARPFLVGFSDASQTAYAACVYINWSCATGRRSVLITAKAKPLPKKGPVVTIPRAELLGCLMLARLIRSVQASSSHDFERVVLLTDSTIALAQISSQPIRLKIWPAVRVEEIQALVAGAHWYHVSSENNIADLATRGGSPDAIGPGSAWQRGPSFMSQPVESWPILSSAEVTPTSSKGKAFEAVMEVRPSPKMDMSRLSSICATATVIDPVQRLQSDDREFILRVFHCVVKLSFRPVDPNASWLKLQRKVVRVIRFILNVLRGAPKQLVPQNFVTFTRAEQREWLSLNDHFSPTVAEMDLAVLVLAHHAQASLGPKTISSMARLNPVQDQFGLWRALGRIHSINTAPIIIPSDASLTSVIARFYHQSSHSGADATLAGIRERFWIVNGSVLVNRVVSRCVVCRKLRKKAVEIEMAPLPAFRLHRSPVFSTVFIDLCGPYMCKADRRDTRGNPALAGKVWVMVIVCAASHAVHLELVENYGTSGFLSALDNFINFRSKPIRIVADSGSQIKSAGGVESLWDHVQVDDLKNHLCDSTEWMFVPSGAHEFVGMAERLVRAVKESMQVKTCTTDPKLDKLQFSRLLYSIANTINDRPLAVGRARISKLDDIRLIRPNDLLFGRSSGDMASISNFDYDLPAKQRQFFEILEGRSKILNEFWVKFYKIVFNTLLPRSKWLSSGRPLSVGDVVIIRDTNPVRGIWTLGQVQEVIASSSDGRIRTALVRYKEVLGKKSVEKKCKSSSKVVLKSVRDLVVMLEVEAQG